MQQCGFEPANFRELADLVQLPILTKNDIQQCRDQLVSSEFQHSDLIKNQTGGSTGEPISFFLDRDRLCARHAATWRHNQWAGLDEGDRLALVWGGSAGSTHARGNGTRFAPSYWVNRCTWIPPTFLRYRFREFNDQLKRFRPKVIQAYARSLALFARYLKDHGIQAYSPKSIITSAETLTDEDRQLIESVFSAPVFNRYGCREFSVVASECEQHDGLHIMAEGLYVEVLVDGRPAADGELGKIVVTDLLNRGMPLIRYEIGDMGALDHSPCPCGRGLPRLRRLEGRVTDFLMGTDGRLVSGVFLATYLIAECPQLGRIQIVQNEKDLVQFVIDGDASVPINPELSMFLIEQGKKYLGDEMQISVQREPICVQLASGKVRYCRSSIL